jgi:hypothetical protein
MKISPAARRVLKLRVALTAFAIAAILAFELCLGTSMAARIGQTTTIQTDIPPVPNIDFSGLVAAR